MPLEFALQLIVVFSMLFATRDFFERFDRAW